MSLVKHFIVPHFAKKFWIMVLAIFGMGFFLSFLIEANFGTDPCTFMNKNLASAIGWSLGNWQITINSVMFIMSLLFARNLIGFGTIFNWVCIGYTADFFCGLWNKTGLHDFMMISQNLPWRIVIFALAILFFVISAATYMNAQLGVAPYDALAIIIARPFKKVPFFFIRILFDLSGIGIGLLASLVNPLGRQGSLLGSVILAFAIGPAVTMVGKFMEKHILNFD